MVHSSHTAKHTTYINKTLSEITINHLIPSNKRFYNMWKDAYPVPITSLVIIIIPGIIKMVLMITNIMLSTIIIYNYMCQWTLQANFRIFASEFQENLKEIFPSSFPSFCTELITLCCTLVSLFDKGEKQTVNWDRIYQMWPQILIERTTPSNWFILI